MKPESLSVIANLERFFASHCDGDWEHGQGIRIETLDNPGWSIKIDIPESSIFEKEFKSIEIHRSEHDWVVCRIKGNDFEAFGGPHNLGEMLLIFLSWARD